MSERRKFTTDFAIGDRVSVIRTRHGWFEGSLSGHIKELGDYRCVVHGDDGYDHEIRKPRDIRLVQISLTNRQEKKRNKLLRRSAEKHKAMERN